MTPHTELSPIDQKIISLLQKDARRSNKELAEAVGVAQSTCLERIRRLRDRGVIRGWHADIDLDALGRPIRALISVKLQPKTTESVRDFQHDMLAAPETLAVSMVSGADDFIVEIGAPDVGGVRDFVLEHVTSRADVVDARTSLIYEQVRRTSVEPL